MANFYTDNTDLSEKTFCRDYEIHLQYSGCFVMSSFKIFPSLGLIKNYTQNTISNLTIETPHSLVLCGVS